MEIFNKGIRFILVFVVVPTIILVSQVGKLGHPLVSHSTLT